MGFVAAKRRAVCRLPFQRIRNKGSLRSKGGLSMPHMPATGVSGIDLYATDNNGQERWCAGNYSMGDTIVYNFRGLSYAAKSGNGFEYQLFLPLYNSVSWMEIGVPADASFRFLPVSQEKPLVIYGTSIAQGACASRPGMAWGNILNRKLGHPVINLGFSGNGKLKKHSSIFCQRSMHGYISLTACPIWQEKKHRP